MWKRKPRKPQIKFQGLGINYDPLYFEGKKKIIKVILDPDAVEKNVKKVEHVKS